MEGQARNETVSYNHPLLRFKIWEINLPPLPSNSWNRWHYHKEVEVIILLEGSMQVETVDTVYELHGQDFLIIGSSQLHRTKRNVLVKQIVLQFDMSAQLDHYAKEHTPALLELSAPLNRLNPILAANPSVKQTMLRLLLGIYEEAGQMLPGFELSISGSFKQLIALFIRHTPTDTPMSPADWQRLKPVFDYIDASYLQRIRIQDVLPLVHLEYHYFIKYFQQCIGMSFIDYIHLRRVRSSEHLLLTSELAISEVGIQCGFPNVAQFIRIFRRYNGCTPSHFRKRHLQFSLRERV